MKEAIRTACVLAACVLLPLASAGVDSASNEEGQACSANKECALGLWCGSKCKPEFDGPTCDTSKWSASWTGDVCQSSTCFTRVAAEKVCASAASKSSSAALSLLALLVAYLNVSTLISSAEMRS